MFFEFLDTCECTLSLGDLDLQDTKKNLVNNFIGYMPAICEDLFPIHILECVCASKYNQKGGESVYICPLGAHNFYAKKRFENIIRKFYSDDEWAINDGDAYEFVFEGVNFLHTPILDNTFDIEGFEKFNIIHVKCSTPNAKNVHIFYVLDLAETFWKNVMENYNIKANFIIDSHKGLGDWFDRVPLYQCFLESKNTQLLPEYYFKGKFISHDAPAGFTLLEKIDCSELDIEIFKTIW